MDRYRYVIQKHRATRLHNACTSNRTACSAAWRSRKASTGAEPSCSRTGGVGRPRATACATAASLQEALANGDTKGLRFQVFDVLHLGDHDLRGVTQLGRK